MSIFQRIDDFGKRTLKVDSLEMSLRQRGAEQPILFNGCGEIVQTEADEIAFKLYADHCSVDQMTFLQATLKSSPGSLVPETSYFDLIARATDNQNWSSEWILPSVRWDAKKAVIKGKLRKVIAELSNWNKDRFCELHFFDDVDLWWTEYSKKTGPDFESHTLDNTTIELMGMKMLFRKRDAHLKVQIDGDEITPDIEMRITEALRFILAKEVKCRVLLDGKPNTIRAELRTGPANTMRSSLQPPIVRQGLNDASWILFRKYFEYVVQHAQPGSWHAISYYLHNARESAVALDLWAMGACVAIEGISHLLEPPLDVATRAKLERLSVGLTEIIEANAEWQPYAKRVKHSLNLLFTKSVKDRLHPLVDRGLVKRAHIQSWGKLRNKHVHPKAADLANASRDEGQNMLDGAYAVTVLLYNVVFAVIGYEGAFTDYSTRGFPLRSVPDKDWATS